MGLGEKKNNWGLLLFIASIVLAVIVFSLVRSDNSSTDFGSTSRDGFLAFFPPGTDFSTSGVDTNESSFGGVSVFFCPRDGCARKLIEKINESNSRIDIAIYSLTLDSISEAIIKAKKRGVKVRVVFDYGQSNNSSSDDELLLSEGVEVRLRNGPGYMHNKYTIIDSNFVATGSFNYSSNADTRNEENLVFIQGEHIARAFEADFNAIWEKSMT